MNQPSDIATILSQAEIILKNMLLLSKHLSLYDEENAVVQTATDKFLDCLKSAHNNGFPVQFTVARNNFLVFDEHLYTKNQMFSKYAYRMFQHGITSVTLTPELTIPSLYSFLRIIMSSPADTWKQGGIISLLEQQNVTGVILTQMSKDDFLLVNGKEPEKKAARTGDTEKFWDRFARSLLSSLAGGDDEASVEDVRDPMALARQISIILTGKSEEDHNQFNKALIRCITTVRVHQPKTERLDILVRLAELINHLDDEPGQNIIKELCALQIPADFAKDLFDHLSNKVIISAFHEAVSGHNYASPMMLSLIKTLADSRNIVTKDQLSSIKPEISFHLENRDIFNNKSISEFVPTKYQRALLKVLVEQQTPEPLTAELKKLKTSLEDFQIEAQASQLSIYILEKGPDQKQIQALYRQIIRSMQFFIEAGDYKNLLTLCQSCFDANADIDARTLTGMMPHSMLKQTLENTSHLEKDHKSLIGEMVDLVGTPFIKPLLELTVTEKNRSNRFFYLNCLKKMGENVIDEATSYLNDDQWFVARNMLLLLGELESKEQLPKIRPLLKHSHSKVRQEALKTCLLLGDSQSIKQIKSSLSSADRQEILNAIVLSKLVKNPAISNRLITMLERKSLFTFDLEMKKALVQSLAENANPAALKVFTKMLSGRHFFNPQAYEQIKIEIVRALAKYPPQQANPLLQQQLKKGNAEAVSLARQILSRNNQENPS